MDEYCNEHKYIKWFETSAKEGYGIDEAAECLVSKILEIENANNRDKESPLNGMQPTYSNPDQQKEGKKGIKNQIAFLKGHFKVQKLYIF